MSPLLRVSGIAGLAAGVGLVVVASVPGIGQPPPPAVVTTDTVAYCHELSDKLIELVKIAPRPPEDQVLGMGAEGRHLCADGQVRGGILRLRRAVMVMLQDLDARGEP